MRSSHLLRFLALPALLVSTAIAAAEPSPIGVVSHIKVLSDKSDDVSTLADWKKTYIKDGMSDQEKSIAIWKTVVKYRHQCAPPNDFIGPENVHDPMKTIHIYGYGLCCCAASNFEGLARYIGLQSRGRMIGHSVSESFYDNGWHLFDGSLIEYHVKPDSKVAGVDEICDAVRTWHEQNPGYAGSDDKLRKFAANDGWKKSGPDLLKTCAFYDANGLAAEGWHGWPTSMVYYMQKAPPPLYEFFPSMGYELNIQLREGEKLTRNWFNKGLFVPGDDTAPLKGRPAMSYQEKLGDKAPGRIGNGVQQYTLPLASGAFAAGALKVEHLSWTDKDSAKPALHVAAGATDAELILPMPTSYLYMTGTIALTATVGQGGSIGVLFSDNNGLDWKPVTTIDKSGPQKIDLKPFCYLRYDYRIKFQFKGQGTGLDALEFTHDILHSQAPLPILTEGDNTITFSAGAQEGTITYEGTMNNDTGKQVCHMAYHPQLTGLTPDLLRGAGDAIYTLEAPGDIVRLRMNCGYRARDAKDEYEVSVACGNSTDFKHAETLAGPFGGNTKYFTVSSIPKGTRELKVKLTARQVMAVCMFGLRMDVDYKQPHGGFRPVKITYTWEENGQVKTNEHVVKSAAESYVIKCGPKTVCKSISLELAK
jgi:hypothetical protein